MSEMVERVGRSAYEAWVHHRDVVLPHFDALPARDQGIWLLTARAAIAAIREPSGEMVATSAQFRIEEAATGYDCNGADVWHTMIDEALR